MLEINSTNFGVFYDFVNFSFILFLIFIIFQKNLINKPGFIILVLFSLTPMFGNNIFFDFDVFPDQSKYILNVIIVRDNYFTLIGHIFGGDWESFHDKFNLVMGDVYKPVRYSSLIIASTPIPFIETLRSLGFFSKFIFVAWFIYLITYKKKFNQNENYYYYLILISPSILIYSSIALKEIYILIFFHLCMFFILQRKLIFFIISLCFLSILRFELLMIVGSFSIVYIFAFYDFSGNKIFRYKNNLSKFLILISILIVAIIFIDGSFSLREYLNSFVERVNSMKIGYHMEGDITSELNLYSHDFSIIPMIQDLFSAILSPTFSKSDSIFLNFFIIENYLLIILFILYLIILSKYNLLKTIFYLIFFLIFNFTVGMFVINDMAIYRYKITMLLPLVLIIREEILNYKNENIIFNKS